MISRPSPQRAVALACASALAAGFTAPSAAPAAPTIAKLRVEAKGRALSPGTSYVNDTARLTTARGECGGSGRRLSVSGPTAIGLPSYARSSSRRLRPYIVSDRFDFGLLVCRIGSFGAFGANQAWLFKVNHVFSDLSADQTRLTRGDEVLWYFADFAAGENTGDELVLRAPARVRPGRTFEARVLAFDGQGRRRPAAGARIGGGATGLAGPDGRARLAAARAGSLVLRARRGSDIPSAPMAICVREKLERCPSRRGERIVGTPGADAIEATAGADVVTARRGADRVDVRGGERDVVFCGRGRDRVRADGLDRVSRACERVFRPRRRLRRSGGPRAAVASPPRVGQMVVFGSGAAPVNTVRAGSATVRVEGRTCTAAARTPLAVLVRSGVGPLGLSDYGSCSRRPRDGGGLFVRSIRGERNAGIDGWVYKVGRRLATAGAADPSGPFGRGRLTEGARVTWFYCRMRRDGTCQRTLATSTRVRAGRVVEVRVTAYDDEGRGRAAAGAEVHVGSVRAKANRNGVARVSVAAGTHRVYAEQPGRVRSFPRRVTVR